MQATTLNRERKEQLSLAKSLCRQVGRKIVEEVKSSHFPEISFKGRSDLVTNIDKWSEDLITEAIAATYPSHIVVGEETAKTLCAKLSCTLPEILSRQNVWVIDPLDGTNNFANKIPHCAVSIAMLEKGVPKIGVVYDPLREELYESTEGGGSFLNESRLVPSEKTELANAIVGSGFPNDRFANWSEYREIFEILLMNFRQVRTMGAAAIELCWVASSRLDGLFQFNLKPWDIAAAALIAQEARVLFSSFNDLSLRASSSFSLCNKAVLFSGPHLYEKFLRLIESKGSARDTL